MPDTSPILGLPIAKGTDPLKQFPTAVDSPRTLALESAITGRYPNLQTVTGLAVSAGTSVVTSTPTVTVAAAPYKRLITVHYVAGGALSTSAVHVITVGIRRDTSVPLGTVSVWAPIGVANFSSQCHARYILPANTAATFNGVASTSGPAAWGLSADNQIHRLDVVDEPAK